MGLKRSFFGRGSLSVGNARANWKVSRVQKERLEGQVGHLGGVLVNVRDFHLCVKRLPFKKKAITAYLCLYEDDPRPS